MCTRKTTSNLLGACMSIAFMALLFGCTLFENALISIDPAEVSIKEGTTFQLTASTEGLTWNSSDESIVSVDENGKVTGIKASSTPITITATQNGNNLFRGTAEITVIDGSATVIKSVTISPLVEQIEKGKTIQLTATVEGTGNFDNTVTWKSLHEAIASVDENGKVTANEASKTPATIIATANGDDTKEADTQIIVVPATSPSSVEIVGKPQEGITVDSGTTHTFTAKVRRGDGTIADDIPLTWSIEGELPEGTTFEPKTGVLTAGTVEGTFDVLVRISDNEDVSDKVAVKVVGMPSFLRIGFQHPGTSVGLIYSKDGKLQQEIPTADDVLDIRIPANYADMDLSSCVLTFDVTDGATVTFEGRVLESGAGTLDLSGGTAEFIVHKGELSRIYSMTLSKSKYAVIPDEVFRAYLYVNLDTEEPFHHGFLDTTHPEVTGCTKIVLDYYYKSLEGIEFFTSLEELDAWEILFPEKTEVTSIDFSKNTQLTKLKLCFFPLTSLDLSQNTKLTVLKCGFTKLTSLDLSKLTQLRTLVCIGRSFKSLDLTNNTELVELNCSGNPLKSLDLTNNIKLTNLWCAENSLTSLNIKKNTALKILRCDQNSFDSLDLSQNTKLQTLSCFECGLPSLDLSKNNALTTICIHTNKLVSLDLSQNTNLERLVCGYNQLTRLDLSQNTKLKGLNCLSNPLVWLDVSGMRVIGKYDRYDSDLYINTWDTEITTLIIHKSLKEGAPDLVNSAIHGFRFEQPVVSGENGEFYTYTRELPKHS